MSYRNWFIGVEGPTQAPALGHLQRLHAREPGSLRLSIELSPARRFAVLAAPGAAAVENPRFWCFVLGPQPPESALLRALKDGRSFEDVHGACIAAEGFDNSVLAVDREAGRVHAVTDRLNVSPIFHRRNGNQHIWASKVSLFPPDGLTPDPAAVASLALNGSCPPGRTLYREISALSRASSHALEDGSLRSAAYWDYLPGRERGPAGWRAEAATAALWRLLARSVDRATRGRQVLLALSGGYDSGVLLGLLGAELKHPDVICFSYAYGEPKPGSDAAVAARQAALYGYRHVTVASYRDDFLGMLDRNAEIGEGLRAPAYEIEAYPTLAASVPAGSPQVMLFGDECFGWGSYRLRDRDDLLGSINLKSPALLSRFADGAGKAAVEALRVGLEANYEELRRAAAPFARPDDAKDFLYLEQRLQGFILPLRRRIAGHWFPVALPFLAPEVLDFMAGVPTAWRLDKRLFRAMGRRYLPDLFRIPRAIRGQLHPDFATEIARAGPALARSIAEQDWRVAGILPPERLAALVREFAARADGRPSQSGRSTVKQRLKKSAKALLGRSRFLEDRQRYLRRLSYNEFDNSPGAEFMLMNLLSAADFFAAHQRALDAGKAGGQTPAGAGDRSPTPDIVECR